MHLSKPRELDTTKSKMNGYLLFLKINKGVRESQDKMQTTKKKSNATISEVDDITVVGGGKKLT